MKPIFSSWKKGNVHFPPHNCRGAHFWQGLNDTLHRRPRRKKNKWRVRKGASHTSFLMFDCIQAFSFGKEDLTKNPSCLVSSFRSIFWMDSAFQISKKKSTNGYMDYVLALSMSGKKINKHPKKLQYSCWRSFASMTLFIHLSGGQSSSFQNLWKKRSSMVTTKYKGMLQVMLYTYQHSTLM